MGVRPAPPTRSGQAPARIVLERRGVRCRRAPDRCCDRSGRGRASRTGRSRSTRSRSRVRSSTKARCTPCGVQLVVEPLEHAGRGDVDVGDGLALQHHPAGRRSRTRWRTCWRNMPALAKNSGASQRNTSDAGLLASSSASLVAVPALAAGHPAEHLAVRPPVRWKNNRIDSTIGDHDALEHAEGRSRRRSRRARAPHARPPHPPTAGEHAEVDQRQRRRDHDRGQRRVRQVGEQPVEEQEQQRDDAGTDEPGELALGARLLGDGGAGTAGRTWRIPGKARRRCWPTRCRSSPGSASPPRRAGVERRWTTRDRVGQRDERDADRGDEQRPDVADVGPRHAGVGSPSGRVPTVADVEVEDGGDTVAPTTATSTAGTLRVRRGQHQQHGEA